MPTNEGVIPNPNGAFGYGNFTPDTLGIAGQMLASGEETAQRQFFATGTMGTVASGRLEITYFTARKTETITQLRVRTGTTAAGATPTLCRLGVYREENNGDLTQLAITASDTSLFAAANTVYTRSLLSSFAKYEGQRYACALICVTGAATPNFYGIGAVTDSSAVALAPRLAAQLAGQADLPASISAASLTTTGNLITWIMLP